MHTITKSTIESPDSNVQFFQYKIEPDFSLKSPSNADVINNAKTFYAIQAFIDDNPAGYILIGYIPKNIKEKYLNTTLDWFIQRFANNEIKDTWFNALHNNDIKSLNENIVYIAQNLLNVTLDSNDSYEDNFKKIDDFFKETHYYASYVSFISYWVDKPNVEYICVYNEEDTQYKVFDKFPIEQLPIKNKINHRSKGLGRELYKLAAKLTEKLDLYLYSSNLQTHHDKKMWNIFDTLPNFRVMIERTLTTETTNRRLLIEADRKKLRIF